MFGMHIAPSHQACHPQASTKLWAMCVRASTMCQRPTCFLFRAPSSLSRFFDKPALVSHMDAARVARVLAGLSATPRVPHPVHVSIRAYHTCQATPSQHTQHRDTEREHSTHRWTAAHVHARGCMGMPNSHVSCTCDVVSLIHTRHDRMSAV